MSAVDPRPDLRRAVEQARTEVGAARVEPSRATPCGDFDVRALVAHLVAVGRKLDAAGRGEDAGGIEDPAPDVAGDRLSEAFDEVWDRVLATWSDDALLDRDSTVAWGTMPGRDLLEAYTHELVAHSWDLARTTGRVGALDPALAGPALDWFSREVPPEARQEGGRFGPVAGAPSGADAYTRLAAFLGREV